MMVLVVNGDAQGPDSLPLHFRLQEPWVLEAANLQSAQADSSA